MHVTVAVKRYDKQLSRLWNFQDWLPTPGSAVVVTDFDSIDLLVEVINELNSDGAAYTNAVAYKHNGVSNKYLLDQMDSRTWGIADDDDDFVDDFQCYVCNRIHGAASASLPSSSSARGLQCPKPQEYMGTVDFPRAEDFWWPSVYVQEYDKYGELADKLNSQ